MPNNETLKHLNDVEKKLVEFIKYLNTIPISTGHIERVLELEVLKIQYKKGHERFTYKE